MKSKIRKRIKSKRKIKSRIHDRRIKIMSRIKIMQNRRNAGSIMKNWKSIKRPSFSLHGSRRFWKERCESAKSKISWTGHPLRSHLISPRATASTLRRIAAGSLISPMAPRRMRRWSGHSGGQSEVNARRDPPGKERLQKIVRMLMGLIKRNSTRDYDKGNPAN